MMVLLTGSRTDTRFVFKLADQRSERVYAQLEPTQDLYLNRFMRLGKMLSLARTDTRFVFKLAFSLTIFLILGNLEPTQDLYLNRSLCQAG